MTDDCVVPGLYDNIPLPEKTGKLYFPTNKAGNIARDNGASWDYYGMLHKLVPPVAGDFAWVNQGGASYDATYGPLQFQSIAGAGNNLRILKKAAPATPYSITIFYTAMHWNGVQSRVGFVWRQSSDGKLVTVATKGLTNSYENSKWTDPTTFSANYQSFSLAQFSSPDIMWLRMSDDGVNRTVEYGPDGINWREYHTVGRTDFLTADEVGIVVNANHASIACSMLLLSWEEE